MAPSRVILVSGAPGAGKSTIATPLAAALRFPLLAKDTIKETLHDSLNGARAIDRAESRRLGGAAMELLWALARTCPRVVLEANFRPYSDYERTRLLELHADIVEIHCQCPPEVAAERFAARARSDARHPTHAMAELTPELLAEFDRPVGIGRVIRVDTTTPVDIERLAAAVL